MNLLYPLFCAVLMAGTSGCGSTPRVKAPAPVPLTTPLARNEDQPAPAQEILPAGETFPASGPTVVGATPSQPASIPAPIPRQREEELMGWFLEGALLEERQKPEDAGKAYAKALELLPGSTYLSAMAGKALLDSGETGKAIEMARAAAEQGTREREIYRLLGDAYTKQKNWDQAIQEFERLSGLEPDSLDTWGKLAILYERTRQTDQAIATYQTMARLDSRQVFYYHYKIASLLAQAHRYEEALQEYQQVAQSLPDQFEIAIRIGQLQEVLGKSEEAAETYQKALTLARRTEDEIPIRKQLGLLYQSRKSYPEAIRQYQRILELDPNDRTSRKILAFLLFSQEDQKPALEEADTLLKDDPGDFQVQLVRREILKNMDRAADAYDGFLKGFDAAAEQGREEEIQYFLVELARDDTLQQLRELNRLDPLNSLLEKCRRKFPTNPRVPFVQAKIAQSLADEVRLDRSLHDILADLEEARSAQNGDWFTGLCGELYSWYKVRLAFEPRGLSQPLLDTLKSSEAVFADNVDLLRLVALVRMDRREWIEAEQALIRAKDLTAPDEDVYKEFLFQLAVIYDKLDRVADIERVMREAIEVYPDDAQAYNFLGYTYADRNIHLEEALALIEKALKLSPQDGNIVDSLGWAYYRLDRNREAIGHLQRALELEKNHPVILDHLGDALQKEGEWKKAVEYWRQAIQFGPDYPLEFTPEFKERVTRKIQEAMSQEKP
ncbi:MAG: tetratricopeptide repeat protein [bacterium]